MKYSNKKYLNFVNCENGDTSLFTAKSKLGPNNSIVLRVGKTSNS